MRWDGMGLEGHGSINSTLNGQTRKHWAAAGGCLYYRIALYSHLSFSSSFIFVAYLHSLLQSYLARVAYRTSCVCYGNEGNVLFKCNITSIDTVHYSKYRPDPSSQGVILDLDLVIGLILLLERYPQPHFYPASYTLAN